MKQKNRKKIRAKIAEKPNTFSAIYLFGSFAKGQERETSDIDVAIVSKRKETDRFIVEVGRPIWDVDTRIEPHIISEEDFKEINTSIVEEIIKTGIKVE